MRVRQAICFLTEHDIAMIRRSGNHTLYCRRCPDPYVYTLSDRLRQTLTKMRNVRSGFTNQVPF